MLVPRSSFSFHHAALSPFPENGKRERMEKEKDVTK